MTDNRLPVVGHVTDTGALVCAHCATLPQLASFHVGAPAEPIEDPSPAGIFYAGARNRVHYDAPCSVCGWAIRRQMPAAPRYDAPRLDRRQSPRPARPQPERNSWNAPALDHCPRCDSDAWVNVFGNGWLCPDCNHSAPLDRAEVASPELAELAELVTSWQRAAGISDELLDSVHIVKE